MANLIVITPNAVAREAGTRLKHLSPMFTKYIEAQLETLGKELQIEVMMRTPTDEGVLANSTRWAIYNRGTKNMELRISQGTPSRPKLLPMWLNFGTGIYGPRATPIVPVRAKALAFMGKGGNMVFAKSVRGMKPRPYIKEAWAATMNARRSVTKNIGRLITQFLQDTRK